MPTDSTLTDAAPPATLAAIDLGSNSFHMIVARPLDRDFQVIDRLKEMVRLAEGLTDDGDLQPEVAARALACLERFGQRLRGMPPGSVRAVGTNTLRQLRPGQGFVAQAEQALGHPIEIIAGREEARLIYLGVANGLAAGDERRLVVDIGGGSTEVIVGEGFTPRMRESLSMGCVSFSLRHFGDGIITAERMDRAELAGAMEIRPVKERFRQSGWRAVVGSSGTIRAIAGVVAAQGWCTDGISAEALERLREALIARRRITDLDLAGLTDERKPVFAGGVAVLRSVFRALRIELMRVSEEALREGLIYEMIGLARHQDVRERSVSVMAQRFDVDEEQAGRVRDTALVLLGQAVRDWGLTDPLHLAMLTWAARLHEIGLAIAHNQYQRHGAYLITNADLSGFTQTEQALLATLVLGHRRRFPIPEFAQLPSFWRHSAPRLCVLLRLAVLLHRGRSATAKPHPILRVAGDRLELRFPPHWLPDHPLTRLELEEEAQRLTAAGIGLDFA